MTAFGRGQSSGENEDFLVEIHSVNSRRLEITVNIPGQLIEFDPRLRKLIGRHISRGRVSVYVSCQPASRQGKLFHVNTEMAREIKSAYQELRQLLGYDGEVDFSIIASHPDLIIPANPPANSQKRWSALKDAAQGALAQLMAMKNNEGQNLAKGFNVCLVELEKTVASMAELAPASVQRHTDKLRKTVEQAVPQLPDNEDRILREILVLSDKLDVSEEITRLESHIAQFRDLLKDTKPCGRTMDFLIQEMNREVHTIGSKADDLSISRLVVHAKTELEKIREQAQNIE